MIGRIKKVVEKMQEKGLEAIIISNPHNRRYLSGFTGSSGYLVITATEHYMLTDFRYMEQASEQCRDYLVMDFFENGLIKTIEDCLEKTKPTMIGFENAFLTHKEAMHMTNSLNRYNWQPMDDMVEKIRMIKDVDEIAKIAHASSIGDAAFEYIINIIKPGISEIEVALELEFFMKRSGASALSFDTIVASGKRSSLPHAVPTEKSIERGDFVTLDFGCIYEGYCSDMTRTVVVGKASEQQKKIYATVLKAQEAALNQIKAGIIGCEGDAFARNIINAAGYEKNFGHGLGHSLGLEVHEQPRFSLLSHEVIQAGTVMSVEPGIYIPGFGGVRIEDLVLIKEDGIHNFVASSKELIEL